MDIFSEIDPDANLCFAAAAWQYSHHVLPGMRSHRGPILTIANWSGRWPGLVGLLNLNGSLVKAGIAFSTLWSEHFNDEYFLTRLGEWIRNRTVTHDLMHVRALDLGSLSEDALSRGEKLAAAISGKGDPRCFRRGLHGHVQRDH